MHGERHELRHRPQRPVQIVKLVLPAAGARQEAGVAIERPIHTAIICEVHQFFTTRDHPRQVMLVRMHIGNREAPIHVRQVLEHATRG